MPRRRPTRKMRRGGRPRRKMQQGGHTHNVPQWGWSHEHDAQVDPDPYGNQIAWRNVAEPIMTNMNIPPYEMQLERTTNQSGTHTHRQGITPRGRRRRGGRPTRKMQAGGGVSFCPNGNYGRDAHGNTYCL